MLTFSPLFAIVLVFKLFFVFLFFFFYIGFLFHDLLLRFQLKISNKSLYVHVFQITSCMDINENRYKYRDQMFHTLAFFPMFF